MFARIRTRARVNRHDFSVPSFATCKWQASAALSSFCFSEQMSAESSSGSIGTTRSGK